MGPQESVTGIQKWGSMIPRGVQAVEGAINKMVPDSLLHMLGMGPSAQSQPQPMTPEDQAWRQHVADSFAQQEQPAAPPRRALPKGR